MMRTTKEFMPNKNDRLQENVPGPYYVDSSCIDCDLCRNTAPQFFQRNDEIGLSIVHRQPKTLEELEQAEDARLGCPTESIGNDGITAPSDGALSLRRE
jgi:ferredoxin